MLYIIEHKSFKVFQVYLALTADVKLWLLFSQLGLLQADGPYHSRRIMGQSTQAGDPHQEGGRISQVSSQEGEKIPQEWR